MSTVQQEKPAVESSEKPKGEILLVDDDQRLLDSLKRHYRKQYRLETACGPEVALELLESDRRFAVVVSDYKMPGMNGAAFLEKVQEIDADAVRIMLTGNADLDSAVDAVNKGQIFRFLTKPCEPEVLTAAMDAALKQRELIDAEKQLLEQTLFGSVSVLAEVLSLANPMAFGTATRIQGYVKHVVTKLELPEAWKYTTAALLSQIGLIAIPPEIIERVAAGQSLSAEQIDMVRRHPKIARDLIAKIPRLEGVADMIEWQAATPGAEGAPDPFPVGSRILRTCLEFDYRISRGAGKVHALNEMEKSETAELRLIEALRDFELCGGNSVTRVIGVREIAVGMVLDQDISTKSGSLVVGRGNRVSQSMVARLRNYAELGVISDQVRVLVSKG